MLIDAALIERLEASSASAVARIGAIMVSTRAPGARAPVAWCGGLLVTFGQARYVNRAVGFGVAEVTAAAFHDAEEHFREADVPPMFEVSSWASASLLTLLGERRYRPAWTRNVHATDPGSVETEADHHDIEIRVVDDALVGEWQRVLADGNGLTSRSDRDVSDEFALARHQVHDAPNLLACIDGEPAGCGSVEWIDGVGWLGGAATLPDFRNRGVQTALLQHRVRLAVEAGCDLVAASALPTGASARNLSRCGFRIAYTQTEYLR